jgi:glyoxalase family protein
VRAYARDAERRTGPLLDALGFERQEGTTWETRGDARGGWIRYEDAPEEPGIPGAGTVHHVAWASTMEDQEAWQHRVADAGGRPTPVIDRFWFRSIYFREPNGVLFEIATLGPGFTSDEPLETLGESLSLPPDFEHLRAQLEPVLTPLPNPRPARV